MDFLVSRLYQNKLEIDTTSFLKTIKTEKNYNLFCEYIENYILDDYSRFNNIVRIFYDKGKYVDITLFQFLINMYLFEFNFIYKIPITIKSFYDIDYRFLKKFNKNVEKIMNVKILPYVLKNKINQEECFSMVLSNLTERLMRLAELVSPIMSQTINLVDIMEMCKRNDEIKNLMSTTLDDSKTSSELEQEIKEKGDRFYDLVIQDKKSCLFPFIVSECAKKQQLTQVFVAVGPRMSATNVVMSHIMKRSYLNGLQNIGDFIAESELALKALIYKKKFVGVSGYMSRETNLTGLDLEVDFSMEDCGTKHYINYNIATEKHLEMAINKNIILDNGKFHIITKNDTDLIGKTVKLRSICTCAHTSKNKVCKRCYGNPLEFKKGYKIGGATATEVENKLSNALMSVKHSAVTNTKEIDDKVLLSLFSLDNNILYLKRLENVENISLVFNKTYIEDIIDRLQNDDFDEDEDEEVDEFEEIGNKIVSKMLTQFKVINKTIDTNTNEETEDEYIVDLETCFLTFNKEILNMNILKNITINMENNTAELKLSDIKHNTPVFNVKYITMETSKYLKELKMIIERSKPLWYSNDLDTPVNDFATLIVDANLSNEELVFFEPLIRALTRNANDITLKPDFRDKNPNFVVLNLETAIFKGDLTSALVYQEIGKILKDIDFYEKQDIGPGIHDSSFNTSQYHNFDYMKRALKKAKLI